MRQEELTEIDKRTYWASVDDPEKAVLLFRDRIRGHFEAMKRTNLMRRIMRSWRYYHGLFFPGAVSADDMAIVQLGDNGEFAGLSINDFRSLVSQMASIVTKGRPGVDVIAKDTTMASLSQARYGRMFAEDELQNIENHLDLATQHALVFNAGYVVTTWNKNIGPELEGDPLTGEILRAGAVEYETPTIFDVAFDTTARAWTPGQEIQWVGIRKRRNRYDLLARYPHLEDKILGGDDHNKEFEEIDATWGQADTNSDMIDTWCFYHVDSDALPGGRYYECFQDQMLEDTDGPNPYGELPIDRIVAGEMLLTALGYSPAQDMQGLQEAMNAEASTIASNHKSLGVQNVWVQEGDTPSVMQLPGGLNVVQTAIKPEALDLLKTPGEVFKFQDMLVAYQEKISGVNSVRRGMPEGGLKGASGAALALIDSKALESNSGLMKSETKALEGILTKVIRYHNRFSQGSYGRSVSGGRGVPLSITIEQGAFSGVDRVRVRSGNPMLATAAGKFEIAQLLLNSKNVTVEEFLTFLETSNYETMLEAPRAQLTTIRQENEAILSGTAEPIAIAIDNHVLHIKEHAAQYATIQVRTDPEVGPRFMAHIMQHMQALTDPATQMLQQVLGFDLPIPPMPSQGGPPGAAPQGDDNTPPQGKPMTGPPGGNPEMPNGTDNLGPNMPAMPNPPGAASLRTSEEKSGGNIF